MDQIRHFYAEVGAPAERQRSIRVHEEQAAGDDA